MLFSNASGSLFNSANIYIVIIGNVDLIKETDIESCTASLYYQPLHAVNIFYIDDKMYQRLTFMAPFISTLGLSPTM
jgi:hypothetical protein